MSITALPTPPSRAQSPENFAAQADALLSALPQFVAEANAQADHLDSQVIAADQSAQDAAQAQSKAQAWATQTSGEVEAGQGFGAKRYAQDAAQAAAAAQTAQSGAELSKGNAQMYAAAAQAAAGIPALSGNAGKVLKVKSDESGPEWADVAGGITNVTSITASTLLTNEPTYVIATPATHGVTLTLPDATTCNVGGPAYVIENRTVSQSIVVTNANAKLIGFIVPGSTCTVYLKDNTTAAGSWVLDNGFDVGITNDITLTKTPTMHDSLMLDATRELVTFNTDSGLYAFVYDSASRSCGVVTAVRLGAMTDANNSTGTVLDSNRVLIVSCPSSSAALQAVVLSISGTTITVGTPANKTLSATHAGFGYYASFRDSVICVIGANKAAVTYTLATGGNQVLAMIVTGTSITLGSPDTLTGTTTYVSAVFASATGFVALSHSGGAYVYVRHYAVNASGNLSAGTELSVSAGLTVNSMYPFVSVAGSRWMLIVGDDGTVGTRGYVLRLSGTTITASTGVVLFSEAQGPSWLARIGERVGVFGMSGMFNTLTDSAGTAVAGTNLGLSTGSALVRVDGTSAYVWQGPNTTSVYLYKIDCSTTSNTNTYRQVSGLVDQSSFFATATTGIAPSSLNAGTKTASAFFLDSRPYQDCAEGDFPVIQPNPLYCKLSRPTPTLKSSISPAAAWCTGLIGGEGYFISRYELAEG